MLNCDVRAYFRIRKALRVLSAENRLTVYRRSRVDFPKNLDNSFLAKMKLHHVELKSILTNALKYENASQDCSAMVLSCFRKVQKFKSQKKSKFLHLLSNMISSLTTEIIICFAPVFAWKMACLNARDLR